MSSSNIIENPSNEEQEKLVQSQFNINVAFYVHLKAYDNISSLTSINLLPNYTPSNELYRGQNDPYDEYFSALAKYNRIVQVTGKNGEKIIERTDDLPFDRYTKVDIEYAKEKLDKKKIYFDKWVAVRKKYI